MFKLFLILLVSSLLGLSAFNYSVICPEEEALFFIIISSICIYVAYRCIRNFYDAIWFFMTIKRSKAISPEIEIQYDDLGQEFRYEITTDDCHVTCFSDVNYAGRGDELIQKLKEDGKITLSDVTRIKVETKERNGISG